jgi:hypothetical protein
MYHDSRACVTGPNSALYLKIQMAGFTAWPIYHALTGFLHLKLDSQSFYLFLNILI